MPSQSMNGHLPKRRRSSPKKRREGDADKTPRTIDVIGNGSETTVSGHIDLLQFLPLHNGMHRRLLETFRRSPGDYEGQYNDKAEKKAVIKDHGNGYLSIHIYNDITQLELSEFLVSKGWTTLAVSQNGSMTFEKWTNVIKSSRSKTAVTPRFTAERHY